MKDYTFDQKTIDYYNSNAEAFIHSTQNVDFSQHQQRFLSKLKEKARILDFGCGSGRDTKFFLEHGYEVDAVDGSIEIAKAAEKYCGIPVTCALFTDLNEKDTYDGIWACSSILHVSKKELSIVFDKMKDALKNEGIIYTSFKYGEYEGERNGRYFTDFTSDSFHRFLQEVEGLNIEEEWITSDVRPGRGEEKWLNLIIRKV